MLCCAVLQTSSAPQWGGFSFSKPAAEPEKPAEQAAAPAKEESGSVFSSDMWNTPIKVRQTPRITLDQHALLVSVYGSKAFAALGCTAHSFGLSCLPYPALWYMHPALCSEITAARVATTEVQPARNCYILCTCPTWWHMVAAHKPTHITTPHSLWPNHHALSPPCLSPSHFLLYPSHPSPRLQRQPLHPPLPQ